MFSPVFKILLTDRRTFRLASVWRIKNLIQFVLDDRQEILYAVTLFWNLDIKVEGSDSLIRSKHKLSLRASFHDVNHINLFK